MIKEKLRKEYECLKTLGELVEIESNTNPRLTINIVETYHKMLREKRHKLYDIK